MVAHHPDFFTVPEWKAAPAIRAQVAVLPDGVEVNIPRTAEATLRDRMGTGDCGLGAIVNLKPSR